MNQNKEHFGPGFLTALTVALGTGIGLLYGRISTAMDDWLFILFGLVIIAVEFTFGWIYDLYIRPWLKRQ